MDPNALFAYKGREPDDWILVPIRLREHLTDLGARLGRVRADYFFSGVLKEQHGPWVYFARRRDLRALDVVRQCQDPNKAYFADVSAFTFPGDDPDIEPCGEVV